MNLKNITLNLGKIEAPPGETTSVVGVAVEPFNVERIVFDGVFDGRGVAFNLWLNGNPFSQVLQVGNVVRLDVINDSGKMFETSVRLMGRRSGKHT